MTSQELKIKLEDAQTKVEKREETIKKLCSKLGIDFENLMLNFDKEYNYKQESQDSYMKHVEAQNIVTNFISRKPERDINGNWLDETYNFNNKIDQLEDNLCKLYDVKRVATGWQVKYDTQYNKENAPKIEAIWNFLCEWENKARDWYVNNSKTYFELKRGFKEAFEEFKKTEEYSRLLGWYTNKLGKIDNYRIEESFKKDYYGNIDSFTREITYIKCKYVYPNPEDRWTYEYVPDTYEVDMEKLNKTLTQEKLAKYYDLCNRISDVVGEITDASNLSIGYQNGELNGIVKGTKGSAKVETVGAGGYNVGQIVNVKCGQRFHYRVLVNKIK